MPEAAATAETTAPSHRFYRPELDALRLLAFLLVFVHHCTRRFPLAALVPHAGHAVQAVSQFVNDAGQGFGFGVSLFYLLSSYLISTLLLRELDVTGRVAKRDFYLRRALRIWPLYYFFTAFAVVLGLIWTAMHVPGLQIAAFCAMVGNWWCYKAGFNDSQLNILWSVSVEEQFYLVWPLIIALFGRRGLAVTAPLMAVATVAALYHYGVTGGLRDETVWFSTLTHLVFFAAGTGLALISRGRAPLLHAAWRWLLALGGLLLLWVTQAAFHLRGVGTAPAHDLIAGYLTAAVAVVLLFLSFLGSPSHWFPKSVRYLGKISYGLYVFHLFALIALQDAIGPLAHAIPNHTAANLMKLLVPPGALALTIALAHFSYQWLESPFLRLKERFTIIRSRAV